MCRWALYVGPAVRLEDIISKPSHSPIRMATEHYIPNVLDISSDLADVLLVARRNHVINLDGFGMGWYPCSTPQVCDSGATTMTTIENEVVAPKIYKTVLNPADDDKLLGLARDEVGSCIFAHNRASTTGDILTTNCHPWTYGRFMWMHNGGIAKFGLVRPSMIEEMGPEFASEIEGNTDSEAAFFLFLHFIAEGAEGLVVANEENSAEGEEEKKKPFFSRETLNIASSANALADAMEKTVRFIVERVAALCDEECKKRERSSLNFAVTDGVNVVAARFRDSRLEPPPSLYYAHGVMNPTAEGSLDFVDLSPGDDKLRRAAIISSEPLISCTDSIELQVDWHLIDQNHLVVIDGNTMDLTFRRVCVDCAALAVDSFIRRIKSRTFSRNFSESDLLLKPELEEQKNSELDVVQVNHSEEVAAH